MKYLIIISTILFYSCQKSKEELPLYEVKKENFSNIIRLSGRAEAKEQSVIIATDDSIIDALAVKAGSKVSKGELLCQLNKAFIEEEIAKESVKQNQTSSDLKIAEFKATALDKELLKSKKLYTAGAVSLEDVEKISQEILISKNQRYTKKVELDLVTNRIDTLKERLNKTSVTSPLNGVIRYSWIEQENFAPGSSVKKGDVLFKIASEGKMIMKVFLKEKEVIILEEGMLIDLKAPYLPDAKIDGKITSVDRVASSDKDSGLTSFTAIVEFEPPANIKSGMELEGEIEFDKKGQIILVPLTSIQFRGPKKQVLIHTQNGPQPREVKTGLRNQAYAEIVSGLEVGDKIYFNYE